MNKKIVWTIIVILVLGLAGWWYFASTGAPQQTYTITTSTSTPTSNVASTTPSQPTSTTPAPSVALPGQHCGGNTMNAPTCSAGYYCAPTPGSHLPFGDVGGTCALVPTGGKG